MKLTLKFAATCVVLAGLSGGAAAQELVCYTYDREGRLKDGTRDDGSQIEYSFQDQSSGTVDQNDNRQQLIQRTGQTATCTTPAGTPGTLGNAILLGGGTQSGGGSGGPGGSNSPPVAVADTASVDGSLVVVNIDVLANDTDPDPGDVLSVDSVTSPPPGGGFVSLLGNQVSYTSGTQNGTFQFTYVVSDQNGATATGTVTVTVSNAGGFP